MPRLVALASGLLFLGCACAGCARGSDAEARPSAAPAAPVASAPATPATPAAAPAASSVPRLSAATPELSVASCTPCELVASDGQRYELRFTPTAEASSVQLEVARSGVATGAASTQRFALDAGLPGGSYLLRAQDLDFDGTLDLAAGPLLGTPNLSLAYFRVDPGSSRLVSLGQFSNLELDAARQLVRTNEKGGHAGLLNASAVYRWRAGALQLVESTEQVAAAQPGRYERITRRVDEQGKTHETREPVTPP